MGQRATIPTVICPRFWAARTARAKIGQLDCLLDTEEIYNRLRKEKRAEYSPARHICYLIAILAEYSSLKNS